MSCPNCALLQARAETAEAENQRLKAINSERFCDVEERDWQVADLKKELASLRATVAQIAQECITMANGLESTAPRSPDAKAYRDSKALTLRWVADRLSHLDPQKGPTT